MKGLLPRCAGARPSAQLKLSASASAAHDTALMEAAVFVPLVTFFTVYTHVAPVLQPCDPCRLLGLLCPASHGSDSS